MTKAPCKYCQKLIHLNSEGGEIGIHSCKPNKKGYELKQLHQQLVDRQHNYLIHGYLMAMQDLMVEFNLESIATYLLKTAKIDKRDLIRCQVESEWLCERILPMIEAAFPAQNIKPIMSAEDMQLLMEKINTTSDQLKIKF